MFTLVFSAILSIRSLSSANTSDHLVSCIFNEFACASDIAKSIVRVPTYLLKSTAVGQNSVTVPMEARDSVTLPLIMMHWCLLSRRLFELSQQVRIEARKV